MLLCRRGPTSYVDLCRVPNDTPNEPVDPTNQKNRFRLTCKRLGLLKDDQEWKICLDEAHEIQSGILYYFILFFCLKILTITFMSNFFMYLRKYGI